jgi:predicted alpha/beta superfamily hydrolase
LSPSDEPLAVVFTTDANLSFPFMANLSDLLLLGGDIPQVLTVGIGYPVGSDLEYVFERRAKDLVNPTGEEGPGHDGVAPLFLRFIREELWPWLSERFDVSDDRTLRGHSLGGGFALYALFHGDGFFKRFVAGSPDEIDFPSRFAGYEEAYAAKHEDLDAIVFLSAGDAENHPRYETNAREMGAAQAARDYRSLKVRTAIFPGESHLTAAVVATTHGMRWVYSQNLD